MTTLVDILITLAVVILVGLAVNAAMYAAIVLYNEHRWRKIKDDKYDNYNKQETDENDSIPR